MVRDHQGDCGDLYYPFLCCDSSFNPRMCEMKQLLDELSEAKKRGVLIAYVVSYLIENHFIKVIIMAVVAACIALAVTAKVVIKPHYFEYQNDGIEDDISKIKEGGPK